jgi:hypothetical protein
MSNDILPLISLFTFSIGAIMILIGSLWFYLEVFKESPLWFFACLIFPFVSIIFLFKYMDRVFIPTSLIFIGVFFSVIGSMLA